MPPTHPPTLLTLTRRTIARASLFSRGDTVLVAVSGGPDSMALLHVLAHLRSTLGHRLVAHGVDHGLRASAAAELDGASELARALDVAFDRTRVQLDPGGNLQARARAARYAALAEAAARGGASRIATAHHAADRAETVLLRLLRGAGPAGLAVLPPSAPLPGAAPAVLLRLVRPFLDASRAAIDAHVARHAIPFAVDPSNADPRFLRARVRHELLPLLRTLSPRIDEHLCALADQLGTAPAEAPPLPRPARVALDGLARARSPRARVALKNGSIARWDDVTRAVIVEPGASERGPVSPRRPRKSSAR